METVIPISQSCIRFNRKCIVLTFLPIFEHVLNKLKSLQIMENRYGSSTRILINIAIIQNICYISKFIYIYMKKIPLVTYI